MRPHKRQRENPPSSSASACYSAPSFASFLTFPPTTATSQRTMSELYEILAVWPVAVNVVKYMRVGDLLNLSKTDTKVRAVLHGFVFPSSVSASSTTGDDDANNTPHVRPDLCIGQHQTSVWKGMKRKARMECCEPNHVKGPEPKMCVYCSMPVCEGCIVRVCLHSYSSIHPLLISHAKESFKNSASTYRTRTRRFCADCWSSGKPHRNHHFPTSRFIFTPYDDPVRTCCSCLAKDGRVCSQCRQAQLADARQQGCIAEGCNAPLDVESECRKICLWCEQPLWQPGLKYRLDKPGDRIAAT